MTTLNIVYGSWTPITCTTTALATDANLLAGRQSTIVDNSTALADDAIFGGTIASLATITANTVIEVWVFGFADGTNYAGGAGATDANLSLATTGVKNLMSLAIAIQQTDTTARTYTIGPISVAQVLGQMPQKWGIFVVHNTGAAALGATTLKYSNLTFTNA